MDELTSSVLEFQAGRLELDRVRNPVWLEAYHHLQRYRRKGEDEVSEFLLEFHSRIEGLLRRFSDQGLPFRHFLLRTLRWQWTTFRARRAKERRQDRLASDTGIGEDWGGVELVAEPGERGTPLPPAQHRRLVWLALKASPFLEEGQLEFIAEETGCDLAWLQACRQRLTAATQARRARWNSLVEKRGEAFYKRLMAEDDARREADPERREAFENRAKLYRSRLNTLSRRQEGTTSAPSHRLLATLLGTPKGSIDSGLYHLKRELQRGTARVYSGGHDRSPGLEQRPQKNRT